MRQARHRTDCNVGIAPNPQPDRSPMKMVSKPHAEKNGVTDVAWRVNGTQ
ncbi:MULTISPECIES: DUF6555 family protein [Pseudomonas]|nr:MULTISPECIES: DUF6555 family protein [Pseudomonas]